MNTIRYLFLISSLVMPFNIQTSFSQTASNPISNEMKNEMNAGSKLIRDGKFPEAIIKYDKICDSGIKNSCYAAAFARYSLALKLGKTEESLTLYKQITPVFEEMCTRKIGSGLCEKLPSILFNRGAILLSLNGSVSSGFKNGALHVTYKNNDGTEFPLSSKPEWPLVKKLWEKSCSLGLSQACESLEETSDVLDTIERTRAPVSATPTPSASAPKATAQTPPPLAAAPPSAAGSMPTQARGKKIYDTKEEYVAAIQRGETPMPQGMVIRNGVLVKDGSRDDTAPPVRLDKPANQCVKLIAVPETTSIHIRNICPYEIYLPSRSLVLSPNTTGTGLYARKIYPAFRD